MSVPVRAPSAERLLALVERFAGLEVGMVADLVVDRFIAGTPKRISREAPVLILRYEGEHIAPGGGANALANVAALGGLPLCAGLVGEDAEGTALLAALAARGIDTSGIRRLAGYRTPTKTRLLAGVRYSVRQQVVRWDVEDTAELDEVAQASLVAPLATRPPPVVLLSDYGYGAVTPASASALRRLLGEASLLLCDSRYRLASFAGLDAATPNQEEAEALLGLPLPPVGAELDAVGLRLAEQLGVPILLVTRGSQGMSLFLRPGGDSAASVAVHLPVHGTDQVADVTGAGDTVIATFALALAAAGSPLEAALLANYAGGIVVHKLGTVTCSPAELRGAITSDPRPREELRWASY